MTLFRINTGFTSFSHEIDRKRFIETGRRWVPGRPFPKVQGYHQWEAGDHASLGLAAELPWKGVEARLIARLGGGLYRIMITRFDGTRQRLGGLSLGDTLIVESRCFFHLWTAREEQEEHNDSPTIDQANSTPLSDASNG